MPTVQHEHINATSKRHPSSDSDVNPISMYGMECKLRFLLWQVNQITDEFYYYKFLRTFLSYCIGFYFVIAESTQLT